jgi:antitoxin (DNA-binding transcriptional repressor) of toxin-antitoxin stability system
MIKVNIHQAKTHFSKYLAKLKKGEIIVICNRNIPIAELRGIPSTKANPRPIGLAKNSFKIPASFFDSLPDDFLSHFNPKEK